MTEKNKKISKNITYFLFFIFFLVGLFTFKDYGMWTDEEFQRFSGFYWLNYVLSFTSFGEFKNLLTLKLNQIGDFTLPSPEYHPYYGVIFDLPAAFLELIFKVDDPKNYFYLRHILNFILFFIGSIFFYKLLLNRFSNYSVSLIGTLFFVLSPRIYGSSFFNNKDVVFLSLISIALYYAFKAIDKPSYKNLLVFSMFAALSTAHRILGVLLPLSFLTFIFLSALSNNKKSNHLLSIVFFCISYYIFLILFWPALWSGPIENLILAFRWFSQQILEVKMLFAGEYIYTNFLPYNYIFTWIFITTPVLYIILFVIGYVLIFKRFFLKFLNIKDNTSHHDLWRGANEKKDLFIFFNITIVVSYFILSDVILYNGWRHIYFINIFLIYIATYAFYRIDIYMHLKNKNNFHYYISVLFLITITYKMIVYHPFQNIYFNNYFNKISHHNYEIDYDGLSGKKFLREILALEKNKNIINIGVASWYPLQRSIKLLDKKDRKKINIVGQEFQKADFIYSNFTSEVDKNINDKYKIPSNFTTIDKFILDNIRVYEVFKKNK
ncbi:MAG: hypothetical protein EVA76_01260 [Candidatus Pelagibacterales bacterium]|nr:MAG: hypothetical protein EVA76_01260 [Pelagibacterales bacterium]